MIKVFLSELLLYLSNHLLNKIPFWILREAWYKMFLQLEINKNACIHMHTRFDTKKNFSIGENSVINRGCRIDNRGGISIGSNVAISENVTLLTAEHDLQAPDFLGIKQPLVIEDYVFIGTGAIILPGVTLHRGSAVGTGAVVTKDVAAHTIVAGNPARPIASRNENLQYNTTYKRFFH